MNQIKYYIDSKNEGLLQKISNYFDLKKFQKSKKFSLKNDFFIVDIDECRHLNKIPHNKILIVVSEVSNKDKLKKFSDKIILYKPLAGWELENLEKNVENKLHNMSDILSTVYLTSKQLEKVNNDFRMRIGELSKNIGNSYIIDSQFFLDELIKIIIDYLSSYLKAARVSILFVDVKKDGEKKDLLYNIQIKKEKVFKKLYVVYRGKVTESILESAHSLLIKDISKTEYVKYMNSMKIYNTQSFMAVPVRYQGETVALIYVTDKQKGVFNKKELNIVETIAMSLERFFNDKINKFDDLLHLGIKREQIVFEKEKLVNDLSKTIVLLRKTQEELKMKANELNILYSINSFVRNTFVVDELLKMIVETIIYSMKVKRASVMLISDENEKNNDILVSGYIGKKIKKVDNFKIAERGEVTSYIIKTGKSAIVSEAVEDDFLSKFRDNYDTNSFIAVPVKIKNQVVAIINVTDKKDGSCFNEDDLKVLEILANQTAITIENFRLSSQLIEREKLSHELTIAKDIQMKLMPTEKIKKAMFEVDFMCIPAREVGGDYVDFIDIDEFNKVIVIGDVSGKGVPAALLMVMLRTLIRSFAQSELSPATLVEKVNKLLVKDIDPKVFATLFYGVLNLKKNTFRYCNAGHNYPVLVRDKKILKELYTSDVVLGFFADYQFHEDTVFFKKDDIFYFYTDGVIEAHDEEGKIFGVKKFYNIIENNKPENLFENLLSQLKDYSDENHFSDDLTISYIKITE
ncbi:MAG: SpoIIE family protein phosphatase [Candidatus Muiribacteriota bacterium]